MTNPNRFAVVVSSIAVQIIRLIPKRRRTRKSGSAICKRHIRRRSETTSAGNRAYVFDAESPRLITGNATPAEKSAESGPLNMNAHEEQFLRRRIDLLESENARLRQALEITQFGHDDVMHDMWLATVSSICKICSGELTRWINTLPVFMAC